MQSTGKTHHYSLALYVINFSEVYELYILAKTGMLEILVYRKQTPILDHGR